MKTHYCVRCRQVEVPDEDMYCRECLIEVFKEGEQNGYGMIGIDWS